MGGARIPTAATCPECGRTFDLTNAEQAEEWAYGHDCEDGGDEEPEEPFTDGPLKGKFATIAGHRGVAWYIDADDGERFVTAHMVGDDRPFTEDRDDVTVIKRRDFCGECGQIGCEHDGLDRDDDDEEED